MKLFNHHHTISDVYTLTLVLYQPPTTIESGELIIYNSRHTTIGQAAAENGIQQLRMGYNCYHRVVRRVITVAVMSL